MPFPPATPAALMPAATPTDAPDDTDVSFASLSVADVAVVECFLLALFEPLPTLPPPPLPMLQLAALLDDDLAPRSVPPPVLELAAGRLTPPLPPPPPPPALLLPLLS